MNILFRAGLILLLGISANAASATAPLRFSGQVVDAQDRPVAGVTVTRYEWRDGNHPSQDFEAKEAVTTPADGSFTLGLPRTPALFVAEKPGFGAAWRQSRNVGHDVTRQEIVIRPPAGLAGTVVDEADKPVVDAQVYVVAAVTEMTQPGGGRRFGYLTGRLARNLFNARTDQDGRFRIEGFPAEIAVDLFARAKGKVLRNAVRESLGPDTMPWRGGDQQIKLVLEPAGSIEGKVVEGQGGGAVEGVRVVLQPQRGGFYGLAGEETAQTGATGVFKIEDVPAGAYRLHAIFGPEQLPDWVAEPVPVTVESGQVIRGVEFKAFRGGLLQVRATTKADHQPVSAANVSAYGDGYQIPARSDTNGVAMLRLLPGAYQVSVFRDDLRADPQSATVRAGETNRLEIELAPPPTLTGVVRRPDGQPAVGAEVRIVGAPMGETENPTGADGRFEVEWEPRNFAGMNSTPCLLVRLPEAGLAAAQEIDAGSGPLTIRLAPGLTFAGEVKSTSGQPITNFTTGLLFWTGQSGMYLQGLDNRTSLAGHFEIRAIPPGRRYGINVSAPGFGQISRSQIPAEASEGTVDLGSFELPIAHLKLSGVVLDSDDKPAAGASVSLHGEGQPSDNVRADKEGRFVFPRVCDGPAQLYAVAQNAFGNAIASGGETNVIIRLRSRESRMASATPPRTYQGTITGPDGKPAAGARVRLLSLSSFWGSWNRTDSNGAYKLRSERQPRLSEGVWLVAQDATGKLAAAAEMGESATNSNLQLSAAGVVAGQIQDPEGKPIPTAEIVLMTRVSRMEMFWDDKPVRADADGRFEITGLPTNLTYLVYASAPGFGRSQQEAGFGQPAEFRTSLPAFQLKRANLTLAGQIVGENEKPVANVQVQTSGPDQPQAFASTDLQGRFKFKVCEGPVRLFAHLGELFGSGTAEGGETNVLITLASRPRSAREKAPRRSLQGRPLPDLASAGLDPAALPPGRPALLCLVDWDQRLSRRALRLLNDQAAALAERGIALAVVQTAPLSGAAWGELKNDLNAKRVAVGRVNARTPANSWATEASPLPWLILVDKERRVAGEGFTFDELESKLQGLETK
jgi:Carboxypeptidase regulatory-like domain